MMLSVESFELRVDLGPINNIPSPPRITSLSKKMSYLFIALTCAVVALSVSYPTGAPKETCVTFSANHTGHQPQSSRPNFELNVSPSNAAPGSTLTVTLQGKGGETFKGFFIQGQNSAGQPVGKFTPQSDAQTRDCSAADDSVTHVSANEKTKVTLKWQAPASHTGKVVFRAVVVKTYELFWNNILSNSLNIA
ncbi:Putative defense protein 3 [Araneus ventricosus]|uniref:Defense protein 3 n=1 Tax=Araneus ventricosus TaxID=182803 RepID=A0A4Y2AW71_ARAVE|nr:Putative defense protein 3 [Araneus ventricosus]